MKKILLLVLLAVAALFSPTVFAADISSTKPTAAVMKYVRIPYENDKQTQEVDDAISSFCLVSGMDRIPKETIMKSIPNFFDDHPLKDRNAGPGMDYLQEFGKAANADYVVLSEVLISDIHAGSFFNTSPVFTARSKIRVVKVGGTDILTTQSEGKVKQKELYKLSLDAIDKAKQEVKAQNILFLK